MKLSRRVFVRTIGVDGAAGVVAQSLGDAPALAPSEQKAIEEIAREFMERFKGPGLSVAFAREGKVVLSRGFGVADQTTGASVTSVSKPITSVAIFSLIEQGRLALDDLVLGNKGRLGFNFGKTLPETAGHPARGNVQDDDHAHRRGRTIRLRLGRAHEQPRRWRRPRARSDDVENRAGRPRVARVKLAAHSISITPHQTGMRAR